MRIKWITLIAISFIMVGCAPKTQIQKIYMQVDHQNPGEVDIFNSFDELGRSFKKVADLKVTDNCRLNNKNRNRMIESLKSTTRELGAEGIVIIKDTLVSGEDVLISGFGKFCVKQKAERKGRNPATGEYTMLPARRVVTFKCSGKLRARVNNDK